VSGGPVRRVARLAALGAGAAWLGYAWGAQCALPLVAVRRGEPGGGRVALTFDDGPDLDATPRVLRLLAARGARATFFLVGARAARHPDLARAIVDEGHEIGNHTWSHRNAWFLGPAATAREIGDGARILGDATGRVPRLYRPPWGIVNAAALRVARRDALTVVLWSLQPEGLRARAAGEQLRRCARRLTDGDIVDLHDAPGLPGASERLLALLPSLLDLVAERGWSAVTVGALLGGKNFGTLGDAG
jgi:peptidoglycan/xylan/chitin deacetylase (PgdA/CDA1 family)